MLQDKIKKIFPDIPGLMMEEETMMTEMPQSEPGELMKKIMELTPMLEMASSEEKLDAIKILLSI